MENNLDRLQLRHFGEHLSKNLLEKGQRAFSTLFGGSHIISTSIGTVINELAGSLVAVRVVVLVERAKVVLMEECDLLMTYHLTE